MLLYRDTRADTRREPPPWLVGAADLQCREHSTPSLRYWGIGPAYLLGEQDAWIDLDDGWQVAESIDFDPIVLVHQKRWCQIEPLQDLEDRTWYAPRILADNGGRMIIASYGGDDFRPILTPVQQRAESIANAAREALQANQAVDPAVATAPLDMSIGARWAAELLSMVNHITPQVLARCHFLDEGLILQVLELATGLHLKAQPQGSD